jgi:hypothetical protein
LRKQFCASFAQARFYTAWVKLRRTQCEHMSSGLLPNSDIVRRIRRFAFVPKADIEGGSELTVLGLPIIAQST